MKKIFIDLFSGIGGFALAAYWAGLRFDKHYFSEIDNYAVQVYSKHFPDAEQLGDIRNVDYKKLPKGDYIVAGGFPCQPHSQTGKRKGSEDERDLWPECRRMLRELQPRIALFENVPGLFTSPGGTRKGEFFNGVLSDITASGYDSEWDVISAEEVGANHKRERVWIVAYARCRRWDRLDKDKKNGYPKINMEKYSNWETSEESILRFYMDRVFHNPNSGVCRNDDGLSEGMDRLRCLGNAIVPHCAEMIFDLPAFDEWRVTQWK